MSLSSHKPHYSILKKKSLTMVEIISTMGLFDSITSIFGDSPNKTDGENKAPRQGASELTPELTLDMEDSELLELASDWKKKYDAYYKEVETKQKMNEDYWLGIQAPKVLYKGKMPTQENRIFADVESFLPIATRQNPEPLVQGDDTEEGQALATKVAKHLAFQADVQRLKLKGKKAMRYWTLYMLACAKIGWDGDRDDIKTTIIRPQKLILDPKACIDEDGYSGSYVGEYRELTAKELIAFLSGMGFEKSEEISKEVKDKLGTKIGFIEWWTNDYVFWSLNEKVVLGKMKNPHWNYEEEIDQGMDEMGQPLTQMQPALKNHFRQSRMPYVFLSVFNLGQQPHDVANLIQQNIPTQDLLNERLQQISKNVKTMNGGVVLSGDFVDKEEAQSAAEAVKNGSALWIPSGDVSSAYKRDTGLPLPSDVYNSVQDMRSQMDNSFGIHGATRGERQGPETLGGKILLKNADSDRISFISDYLEQFYDAIYNWWLQMMHVYYNEQKNIGVEGDDKKTEFFPISRDDFNQLPDLELLVSVREGSLIPKDPLLKRNEAVELFTAGALDPITLFQRLDYPSPQESAERLYKWLKAPELLFPDVAAEAQQSQMAQMQGQEPATQPSLPPEAGSPASQPAGASSIANAVDQLSTPPKIQMPA